MLPVVNDPLTPIVARILRIEDTTWGDEKKGFIVRFRGQLYNQDSAQAYDQLAEQLRELNVTPLFRIEDNRHTVVLVNSLAKPKPSKIWVNILLFILTVVSVTFTGAVNFAGSIPTNISEWFRFMLEGLPFAVALLAILVCHEFGHYFVGRYHKAKVTLPYFMPLPYPLSLFGTMGAFIQLKEIPKNKRDLLDIGIAGPIAGLIVAIPVLIYGLSLSTVERLPFQLLGGQIIEGNSILYLFLKFMLKGQLLPQPFNYSSLNPVIYWIQYFFTGKPLPIGGLDVTLHPIAWAGWAGLFVTAINLIPAGQLDGGHIMYALLGKRTAKLLPIILFAIVLLGFAWYGWWLFAALIFFLIRTNAEPLDQITPLDPKRKALAILGVVIFLLIFMPVPLTIM
jgi:membrane-associated protease RseP (regulator of RpoE activity)